MINETRSRIVSLLSTARDLADRDELTTQAEIDAIDRLEDVIADLDPVANNPVNNGDPPPADERPEDTGMDKDDYLELMAEGRIDPADPTADPPSDRWS